MQGKSKAAAIIIVSCVVSTLGLYLWAGSQRAGLQGYGFMRVNEGELVVNFDRSWVWLSQTGRERRTLDLESENLRPVGDFDFFANGDLLIYHRQAALSVGQNLKAFLRLRQAPAHSSAGHDGQRADGFYRCRLSVLRCDLLPNANILPARSFRLVIDSATDVIYLADTSDHSVYKLSGDGEVLASRREGFKFPNQLLLRDGALWLADTNHHRVVVLDTHAEGFARERSHRKVTLDHKYRWPLQLATAPQGLWVLVGDSSVANARLAFIDRDNDVTQPLAPEVLRSAGLNDPLAIKYWLGALWINDFTQPKLRRVNPTTGDVQTIDSPRLQSLEQAYTRKANHYRHLEALAIGLFVLVIVGGVIAAWVLEKEQTRQVIRSAGRGTAFSVDGEMTPTGTRDILWLSSALKPWHHWLAKIIWLMWALILLVLLGLYFSVEEASASILQLGAGMAIFLGIVCGAVQRLFGFLSASRLGVIGESLVLVDGRGQRTIASGAELAYSPHFIFADHVAVVLGNPQMRFFTEIELKKWVYPRLRQAQKLSAWQPTQYLWRLRHPQIVYSAVLLAAVLGLYVFIEYFLA
ncbi:hypothetical protein [Gilvimarinus xylanilyticus]|uniref:Uncharacterized protein n=1 Tax=Gilvimarinus xylanilyticus TaxID=2944139 RepID=A0A9X2I7C6_9GAMM|nr:hypothetical protein [Gilvimarinus xylanilyticus]MCP8900787.1 hypothetical protein [Gilvimarinus xylanilyticus]